MHERKKVLFISSGNKLQGISPIVSSQAESLEKMGIAIDYYAIIGKGVKGYFRHLFSLRAVIRKGSYYAIHAHYSWSGIMASLASPGHPNLIVSLMGSFYKKTFKYYLVHFFARYFWKAVIVKSERMKIQVNLKKAHLIPNGVNLDHYSDLTNRSRLRKKLKFDPNKKYVVFVADPYRPEKNYKLCKNAVNGLTDEKVELITVFNKAPDEIPQYHIAADVLMLTSFNEGSPNVIKEAMAACCPIVATHVGDVEYIIGNTDGCYILKSFEVEEASTALRKALDFGKRTNGIIQIRKLGIDTVNISKKIIELYDEKYAQG
jgi:glycosyltransferase involved in cell wall biosynthesis